jgi:hypothetical protein
MYPLGKQALLGSVVLTADNIKVVLINTGTYTYSAAHQYYSDLSGTLGASANLASKTVTNGVFNAANTTVTATSTATCGAFVIYKDTGTTTTSPLLMYYDGIQIITIAANSSTSTTITVDPLTYAIANSAVLTRVSGTGPSSVTLSGGGGGAAAARTLTASATQSMVQGDTYSVAISGTGLPININNGQTVNLTWDTGSNKIFAWNG